MQKILHVSDNPEHFSSIGSALAQIPANNTTPVIIEIAPGIYHEKLTINHTSRNGRKQCSHRHQL